MISMVFTGKVDVLVFLTFTVPDTFSLFHIGANVYFEITNIPGSFGNAGFWVGNIGYITAKIS